jgi:hypothetical protein
MTKAHLRIAGVLALLLPLDACSRAVSVSGKVIRGDVNFIGAVDPADPRLKSDGLPGAEIAARGTGTRSDRILADAHSGKSGDFTLRIDDQDAMNQAAEFRAHLPGYGDASGTMGLPAPDRRLLVIVKPLTAGGPAK